MIQHPADVLIAAIAAGLFRASKVTVFKWWVIALTIIIALSLALTLYQPMIIILGLSNVWQIPMVIIIALTGENVMHALVSVSSNINFMKGIIRSFVQSKWIDEDDKT